MDSSVLRLPSADVSVATAAAAAAAAAPVAAAAATRADVSGEQYVGKSCCAKDVAYCLICACADGGSEEQEQVLLSHYHAQLCAQLERYTFYRIPAVNSLSNYNLSSCC